MNIYEFFTLLRSARDPGVREIITEVVASDPGIVADAWQREYGDDYDLSNKIWLWAFTLAGYTYNFQPAPRPGEPIFLYRGCLHERRFGMAWTPMYGLALRYADYSHDSGPRQFGNVYGHWAWPREILAHIYRRERNEAGQLAVFDALVLDYRCLNEDVVQPVAVNQMNFAEQSARSVMSGRPINFAVLPPSRLAPNGFGNRTHTG